MSSIKGACMIVDSDNIILRAATAQDAEAIARLWAVSVHTMYGQDGEFETGLLYRWCEDRTPERLSRDVTDPEQFWVVAELDGFGLAGVGAIDMHGEVLGIYVRPKVMRQGIGRALLRVLEQYVLNRGLRQAYSRCTAKSLRFFQENGYAVYGAPVMLMDAIPMFPVSKKLGSA